MRELRIIKLDPSTNRVSFEISSKFAEGIFELIQTVILSLLNIPGKNVLDPQEGGGLPAMIGENFDPEDPNEIFAEVARRIRKTETDVINRQLGLELSPESRLRNIDILELVEGSNLGEIFVKIRIYNVLGRAQDAVI